MYAFCLMPDYCKIIAEFPNGNHLREFIRCVNRKYEDHLFIVHAVKEHWFRNEAPIILYNSHDLLEAIQKIEQEPVSAGLVRFAPYYPFSSAYHRSCRPAAESLIKAQPLAAGDY
jgi:hypothetical protein